jgi:hypothetical protein
MYFRYDLEVEDCPSPPLGAECMEVPLLVPVRQYAALERAANSRGLTTGQLLRQLIAAYLEGQNDGRLSTEMCRIT